MTKKIEDYTERISTMIFWIKRKGTGTREEFAEKVGVSPSSISNYIAFFNQKGVKVSYDPYAQTYFFEEDQPVNFFCGFTKDKFNEL